MSGFEIFFIYVISWWMVLFMALPFGAVSHAEAGRSEAPNQAYHGSPVRTNLKKKLLATTAIAAVVTAILSYLIANGVVHAWLPYQF